MDNLSHILFEFKERLGGYQDERRRFRERAGYEPNLDNPRSFSEKVVWKKLHDRNPLLSETADKYEVRKFVLKALGKEEADKILIPLLAVTDKPESIDFDSLPEEYILKSNHTSGRNLIVQKGDKVDRGKVVEQCKKWLRERFGIYKHEWAYQNIKPKIIIEKLIRDGSGQIPKDFKFYIFGGHCRLVHVDFDRFVHHTRSLFDEKWNFLPVTLKFPQGPIIDKPEPFDQMKRIAESLGKNFDFVRVDLYTVGDSVYFGELTHYPGSGMERFTPESFDFELGKYWLNQDDPKENK